MQDSAAKSAVDSDSTVLLASHLTRVKHLAQDYTNGSNTDDLVQEGLMALLKARQTWREEAQFFTYARVFVISAMIRYATRETAELVGKAASSNEALRVASCDVAADVALESAELLAVLADGMIVLTEEERRVTRLHFIEGISLHEIARTRGVSSKDAACRIINSAIAKLRERVQAGM